jgi:UDP-glucose 4-epimerase
MSIAEPIFLTGGTGYVGGHLRQQFIDRGLDVNLLVRPDSAVDTASNETVVRGDLTNGIDIGDAETIVHLAAQTSVEQAIEEPVTTWEVNATGTLSVLEAARKGDVGRVLLSSTASVYGPPEYLPIDESHPLNAVEPYGVSKLAADRLLRVYERTYDIETVIGRLFNTFGPGQAEHNVVPAIVSQAFEGGPVQLGNLTPSRDFLYIEDAVDALVCLLEEGMAGEVYNVGRGEDITIGDLAEAAVKLVDSDIEIVSETDRQRDDDVEIPRHIADASKLRTLGWEPSHGFEEALERTIEAYRQK